MPDIKGIKDVINSKTIIGSALIISGVWLFSGGVAQKFAEHDYKKSAKNIAKIINDASSVHSTANSTNINNYNNSDENIYE